MDDPLCPSVAQRNMWEQVFGREAASVVTGMVCHLLFNDDSVLILFRPASYKADFKKPGKNAMNTNRAVLITGPPGIGKTTSAHLCAKLAGYTPIELNASDARSKKLVEVYYSAYHCFLPAYQFKEWYECQQYVAR